MRVRAAIFGFLCLTLSAWSQLTYTVPVTDKSEPGNPVKISGTASFSELVLADSVTSSSNFLVEARNVSGKAIILLLGYFDEAGPYGGGTRHLIEVDHFFWGEIDPGLSFVLARSHPGTRILDLHASPSEPVSAPKAEVNVEYVEFLDGSSYGDATVANDIHEMRTVMFDALRRIDRAGSTEEFQGLLEEKIQPDAADSLLAAIRHTEKRYGVAAARRQIHTAIFVAEQRTRALRVFERARK